MELRIPGQQKPVKFLTLKEVADKSGKTTSALKKLIYTGKLPDSNFRAPDRVLKRGHLEGTVISGARLYSKDVLVPVLVPLLRKIQHGKKISADVNLEIANAFRMEREVLINKK